VYVCVVGVCVRVRRVRRLGSRQHRYLGAGRVDSSELASRAVVAAPWSWARPTPRVDPGHVFVLITSYLYY